MTDSLKICLFGNQHTTTEMIKNLLKNKHGISYVVTLKKDESTISKISNIDTSLDDICKLYGINIYYAESYDLKSEKDKQFFKENNFDIGLSCTWQRIIPEDILNTFKIGVFGWHGSMFRFPDGRGRSPLNWSIRLGGKKIYHNLFKYDSGIDTGDIFETKLIRINKWDDIKSILPKVQSHMNKSSIKLLDSIYRGSLVLSQQKDASSIIFPKLSEKDGEVFSTMTYEQARNIVRSCTNPFPGAFISHLGMIIKIWKIKKSYFIRLKPGQVRIMSKYTYIGFINGTGKFKSTS